MIEQCLGEEIVSINHKDLYLSEESIYVFHVDLFKVIFHTEIGIFNDEDHITHLIDQFWMRRWSSDMALKLPQKLNLNGVDLLESTHSFIS